MLSRILFFLIVSVLTIQCEFKGDPPPPTQEIVKPFNAEDVKLSLVPLPHPNQYGLEVTWHKVNDSIFLKLKTDDQYTQIESGKNSHRVEIQGGTTYELLFERRDSSGTVLSVQTFHGETPTDFVVEGTETLSGNLEVSCGRMFIQKNAVLQIQNFTLSVRCAEFISDSGTIETFPLNSVAQGKGARGRSGGAATIKVSRAKGSLYLNLRGESGTDGRNGLHGFDTRKGPFRGCRGQDGGAGGSTGSVSITTDEPTKLQLYPSFVPGRGGKPGHSIAEFEDREAIRLPNTPGYPETHAPCIETGGSGSPGAEGVKHQVCLKGGTAPPECR